MVVEQRAIEVYGVEHQKRKAIEELGELIVALSREQDGRSAPEDVITEIADVVIMTNQLALIYGIDDVSAEVRRKKERLKGRIKAELQNGKCVYKKGR